MIKEFREIERLSHLQAEQASTEVMNAFKDVLQGVTRPEWEQIVSNVRNNAEGLVGCGHGYTILHAFAGHGNDPAIGLLVDKGANTESNTDNKRKPLICAACNGHDAVVKLLLDRGAKIEAQDDNKCTALIVAAGNGHEGTVRLLLDRGANIEADNKNGYTSLIMAAWEGNEAVVELLLQRGAEINAKDHKNYTPLMRAAMKGHVKIVHLLLGQGADIEARSLLRPFLLGPRMKAIHLADGPNSREIKQLLADAARNRRRPS